MRRYIRLFAVLGLFTMPTFADLLGSNVGACWNTVFGGAVTTDTAQCNGSTVGFSTTSATIVDPGVEFSINGIRSVDFTGTTFTVTYSSFSGSASPDLFIFTGLPGTITSVSLLTSNPLNVTTAFTPTSIGVLVGSPECCAASTATVTYQVGFASSVPEPATYALTGLAIPIFIYARRRRLTKVLPKH